MVVLLELIGVIFVLGSNGSPAEAFNMKISRPGRAENPYKPGLLGLLSSPRNNDIQEMNYKYEVHREIERFTNDLLKTISKYTNYANSDDEVTHTEGLEDEPVLHKRSQQSETHVGGCTAVPFWDELGSNYYPRFIRSYSCSSRNCQIGTCREKSYTVNVLMKLSQENRLAAEDCPTSLPSDIRCNYKLVPKNVTTYCECRAN